MASLSTFQLKTLLGVPCRVVDPLLWKCERRVCAWGQMLDQPVGGDLCANLLVVICLVGAREEELYGRYDNNDNDNCS